MKLLHLRHHWVLDEAPGPVPRQRCTRCGKSKDAGVPGDRHAVNEGRSAHARASGNWPGNPG